MLAIPFAFPPTLKKFCHSTFSPASAVDNDLNFGHFNKCVVVSHCFNLHFPDDPGCETSFYMLICHLCIFFGEMSVQVFAQFLFRLFAFLSLSFKSYLCILTNSPFSDVTFARILCLALGPKYFCFNVRGN